MRAVVCVGHVTPDADCLGSMLGFARVWTASGRQATAALPPGSMSNRLGFLLDWSGVASATEADFASADAFVVVDAAQTTRLNLPEAEKAQWPHNKPVINIDHHVSNTRFGTVNWVVDGAASACELVCETLDALALPIDPVAASLLYGGLLTDTGGFSLPNTTGPALRVAASLLERGADVRALGERINRAHRPEDFRLTQTIYANTHLAAGGRIAYSTANFDEIVAAGCTAADIDEQVSIPRSVAGIRVAILFTEGNKGRTRVNFRGEAGTDVLALAQQFGGGGHREAAGTIMPVPLADAVAAVMPAAEAMLASGPRVERKDQSTP
jgi:phosphoesterase RecJ-like protein